jgi:hypothetical protein
MLLFFGMYFADYDIDESGLEFKLRFTSYHSTFARNDRWRVFSDEKVV